MTEQAQRIAIAEACGWKYVAGEEPTYGGKYKQAYWVHPNGKKYITDWKAKTTFGLPDYLHDLNAMHKAEGILWNEPERIELYQSTLQDVYVRQCGYAAAGYWFMATAAQRAEAFLRTLGKWEDKK